MSPTLRRHGTNIALVALVGIVGAYVLVADRGSVTTTERATRKKNLLASFHDDDVGELKVTAFGGSARVFRGALDDAGQRPWKVEIDGATWPAEEANVDRILAALRDGVVDRWLGAGAESPGDARATLALTMGNRRWLVTLRGPAPTPKGAIYVEVQGDGETRTGVITAQLAAVLLAEPASFRQRTLVSAAAGDVTAIAIEGEGGTKRLVKSPWPAPRGGSFRFDGSTPEGSVRVAAGALDEIWDAIGKISADAFLPDAEADKALDRKIALAITTKSAGRTTIDLGGACPGHADDVVAVRRDQRGARISACVPRAALETLSKPVADLVDRRLVGARVEEVIDLKLASGGATIAMARSGSQWHQQSPVDRVIDTDVGKDFVEHLCDAAATKLVSGDPKALGLDPPRATLRVVSLAAEAGADAGDAERTELIEIGAEQSGVVHVRRVEDGAIAEVPAEVAEGLLPSDVALRSHKIYGASFANFRALRVTSPVRAQKIERGADGSWAFVEPKAAGIVPDATLLGDLGDALGGLTADRWIGAARPEHGLGSPRLTVEADLDGDAGARTLRVQLGAPAGGSGSTSFARAGDDPAVFVATRRIEEAADRWLVDRTALVTEVSRVRRVTLTAPGAKKTVIEASGGAFHVAGAPADPVANTRAAAVREALADLVAEAATTVGKPPPHEGLDKPALEVAIEMEKSTVTLRFGAGDTWKGTTIYYARRSGVDATFAVAQAKVRPLIEAAGGSK